MMRLGAALVAVALIALPIAVWVSSYWGFVSGATGLVGLTLLGIAYAGSGAGKG